jgi:6-phosphogluconolactonase/glucosamine-6-phosphate isomerase/deaminase
MSSVAPPPFAISDRAGLTLRALNATRLQVVLCTGNDKQSVRRRILSDAPEAASLPVARLSGVERTVWIVDPD